MIELFLIAALALPSSHHTHPALAIPNRAEWQKIVDFIEKIAPGAEIYIKAPDTRPPKEGQGWERWPFKWNEFEIWYRRKPVSDKFVKGAS